MSVVQNSYIGRTAAARMKPGAGGAAPPGVCRSSSVSGGSGGSGGSGARMLSLTSMSESLHSGLSCLLTALDLEERRRRCSQRAELQRLKEVRAAAQIKNLEDFLKVNHLSLKDSMAYSTGMMYRNLGRSGLRVSCLGLGAWVTFGGQGPGQVGDHRDQVAEELTTLAYDNGINLFDTAGMYNAGKAELVLGRIIKKKGWRRSSLVITTKIFWGGEAEMERGLSRKHVVEGLKASLQRLQLDYIDVVFASRPDPSTPVEETVRAMSHVINRGLALYWGTSRWSATDIMEAYSVARQFNQVPPICEQAEYHMFHREKVEGQLPELFHKIGVGAVARSPLASGLLSGRHAHGVPSSCRLKAPPWKKEQVLSEEGLRQQVKLKELQAVAERLGCTLPQLAIAWCLRNEAVNSVLLGASGPDQLLENIRALEVVSRLSVSVVTEVDLLLGNKPRGSRPAGLTNSMG